MGKIIFCLLLTSCAYQEVKEDHFFADAAKDCPETWMIIPDDKIQVDQDDIYSNPNNPVRKVKKWKTRRKTK